MEKNLLPRDIFPFEKASEVKYGDLWGMISKIFQSNTHGIQTDNFEITSTVVKLPVGKGRTNYCKYNTFYECIQKKKGFIQICTALNDNLCLPRAIVVAQAYADGD